MTNFQKISFSLLPDASPRILRSNQRKDSLDPIIMPTLNEGDTGKR